MKKRIYIAICSLLSCGFLLCGCEKRNSGLYQLNEEKETTVIYNDNSDNSGNSSEYDELSIAASDSNSDTVIFVHICGAVKNAGVYEFKSGDRVFEAVEAAGGFTEEAAEDYINLASVLSDGTQIVIPTKDEVKDLQLSLTVNESVSESTEFRININTADSDTLMMLPGVGKTRAEAIIEYRESVARFNTTEEIMNVSGIGESTYNKFKDRISVGP